MPRRALPPSPKAKPLVTDTAHPMDPLLEELEQRLGYCFVDRSLLLRSLTHKSLLVELPFIQEETKEAKLNFLYRCIAELEETDRIIISLVLEDLPQEEIAEVTGMGYSNIRVRIHRIKEKLTEKFKQHGQFE